MYINARVLRDMKARVGVKDNEVLRRAYLYVARNTTLPPQVRHQAQLQLNTFGRYTRPTTVKNRCTASGRGRGVMSEFGLCRVRPLSKANALLVNLTSFSPSVPIPSQGTQRRTQRRPESFVVAKETRPLVSNTRIVPSDMFTSNLAKLVSIAPFLYYSIHL